jgi:hypothetical protein
MKTMSRLSLTLLCALSLRCGHTRKDVDDDGGAPDAADTSEAGAANLCPAAPRCGGELAGTWNISDVCFDIDVSSYAADCETSTARAENYALTGTLTFNVDQTYSLVGMMTGDVVLDLPAECLTPAGGAQIPCSQLQPALLASGKYRSVACAVRDGGGCVCRFGLDPQSLSGNGTYTTAGGVLMEMDSKGTSDQDYCVTDGTTLALSPPPAAALLARQGVTFGTVTLTKRRQ